MAKKYVVRVSDGYSKVDFAFTSAVNANNFALGALECCVPSDNKYRDEDGVSTKIFMVSTDDSTEDFVPPVDASAEAEE